MNPEDFFDSVQQDTERRLADPLPFALDALSDLFGHQDDVEQGFAGYEVKLEHFFWWADDAIQCLEKVLADPPDGLGRMLREQAHVTIARVDDQGVHIADEQESETWLRDYAVPKLRKMFDTFVAKRTEEQIRARGDASDG